MDLIKNAGAKPAGVLIALDRQEQGTGERSAIQEVQNTFGIPVVSIIKLDQVLDYLNTRPGFEEHAARAAAYRQTYGI